MFSLAFFLNERAAPPVARQSMIKLGQWRRLLAQSGELRLAMVLTSETLRITSPLVAIDLASAISRTNSGRLYHFTCLPVQDELIGALIAAYVVRSGLADAMDVSNQAWMELSGTTQDLEVFRAERIKHESIAPDSKTTHLEH